MVAGRMTPEEAADIIEKGVAYRARKHFRLGDFTNPYSLCPQYEQDSLKRGMAELWDKELERLFKEKLCPCCGQATMGDLDY